ncbi:MAG: hypothetical protein E6G39_16535 [Actinobacteria bacterium]|jgi:hypothetical protein|nr:MAG: hypothetical protein E6G39_16535 [Actinomycetota bacterium]
MEATSIRFSHAARAMRRVVLQRGLDMPLFRSPPRLHGVQRSLTRRAIGASTVAVRLRQRPWPAVLADMIEGVVVVNALQGSDADELRNALWSALESDSIAA